MMDLSATPPQNSDGDDLLHVALVRSTVRHGLLLGLEVPHSMRAAGVQMIDHRDCGPRNRVGPTERSRPILAARRVLHIGEIVAAVAADSTQVASAYADEIVMRVEERAEVADIEASSAARVRLTGDTNTYFETGIRVGHRQPRGVESSCEARGAFNLSRQLRDVMGQAIVLAAPQADGRLAVRVNAGDAGYLRQHLAESLGLEESLVAVEVVASSAAVDIDVNELLQLVVIDAVMAIKSNTRCQLAWQPADRMSHGSGRPAAMIGVKGRFDAAGKALVLNAELRLDAGARDLILPSSALQALRQVAGPYRWGSFIGNAKVHATNNLPDYGLMGEGFPGAVFAREQFMDIAAKQLSLTQADIRLINLGGNVEIAALMLREASEWVGRSCHDRRIGRALGYIENDGVPSVDAVEVEVDAVTWEIRIRALRAWRLKGSATAVEVRLNILREVGLAVFEDVSAAAFGVAAYRPGTSVELPSVQIDWMEDKTDRLVRSVATDSPATGSPSACVSAVAEATGLRAADLPLLPEVLVDLHLIHTDCAEVTQ